MTVQPDAARLTAEAAQLFRQPTVFVKGVVDVAGLPR